VNLGRAIQAAFDEGLLMAGGGHAMAAGLTVRAERIDAFRGFLGDRLLTESAAAAEADGVDIDALISPRGADRALFQDFQRLTPFGPGNPEPMFAAANVLIDYPQPMRGGHIRCTLTDGAGGKLKAIAWRAEDTDLGRRLLRGGGAVHVAGRLKADDWNGREGVQLEIEDAADPRMTHPG
jgi:single-stranded-DNA-specific exonuclease